MRLGDRHGRDDGHRETGASHGRLLRPRVVRTVHAVPRGLGVVGQDDEAHRRRARHRRGSRYPHAGHPEDGRDHDLRAVGLRGGAGAVVHQQVQGRISRSRPPWRARGSSVMADLVNLTIDGHEVSVPKGTTILEAAKQIGTEVPHYCYHPSLSSPAMCRLCLVEVEGAPKPMPSCVTTVTEGQVVRTQSERALDDRRAVLEFYLVNHPLDCPICDRSGECYFQDYVHAEGPDHGHSREPKRVLGRDDFGGDILFYGDRCVMCTRCVRFMNEVEQEPRLTVVERGSRSVIDTFFDEGLEGTHWHGNIVDLCPVGALISKDFLHKARAWDLQHTPS